MVEPPSDANHVPAAEEDRRFEGSEKAGTHLVQSSEAFTAFVHSYDRFLGGSEVL